MKRIVQSLGIAMLLASTIQLSAQRYLSEIFSALNITNDVTYGQNLTVIGSRLGEGRVLKTVSRS